MKLADLRKLAIRKQVRVRFPLKNGMECVVNEKGVAQVPALNAPPDFSLEEELSAAGTFVLEAIATPGARVAAKATMVSRVELSGMTHDGTSPGHDEHDDE
ncbi:MAG TPA: hypothetical protein VMS37_19170 [Verrucomicrobiae bacterium]|nr:hypothetical protein [Verrucomicrobiae bacterium]